MEDFLDQIDAAVTDGTLYYLALAGALMVPDICGALDASDGEAKKARYIRWVNQHLSPLYADANGPALTGLDCYRFRCSFLHQGRTQHTESGYARIMFIEPPGDYNPWHMAIMEDNNSNPVEQYLALDLRQFCLEVTRVARQWLASVRGTQPYESNIVAFVTRYPTGFYPYGGPVIT